MEKTDSPEVKAFFSKLNFFRKPLRLWKYDTWIQEDLYAGGGMVQKVLDGKSELSLRLNLKTSFFCFDLDLVYPKSEATPLPMDGLFRREMDLKQAIALVSDVFRHPPSLFVASPSGGAHLYYCLDSPLPWLADIESRLQGHRDEARARLGTPQWNVELLPTPSQPLRLPRRDRILDPVALDPLPQVQVTEEFWNGLVTHPLEEILDPTITTKTLVVGSGVSASPSTAVTGRPRTRVEIERAYLPFRNGGTNQLLHLFVNAARHDGLSFEETLAWIEDCISRSRKAGYTGDLGTNPRQLAARVDYYYQNYRALGAVSTKFWLDLWDREKASTTPEFRWAESALDHLKACSKVSSRSDEALSRFFLSAVVWKDILNRSRGELDALTLKALDRKSLPLPSAMLDVWYSGYKTYWRGIQKAGILVPDPEASYIPIKGRVQYSRIKDFEVPSRA